MFKVKEFKMTMDESILLTKARREELRIFCQEVLKAIDREDADNPIWFYRRSGICYTANAYDKIHSSNVSNSLGILFRFMLNISKESKVPGFPFNDNFLEYDQEYVSNTTYKNEKRLAFLKKWA